MTKWIVLIVLGVVNVFLLQRYDRTYNTRLTDRIAKTYRDMHVLRDIQHCDTSSTLGEQKKCFETSVLEHIHEGDISQAFDVMYTFMNADPVYSVLCHDITHSIGHKTYRQYRNGINVPIRSEYEVCSSGFFHGLLEYFVKYDDSYQSAIAYCNHLTEFQKGSIVMSCFHGVGHGFVLYDQHTYITDPNTALQEGINKCESIHDLDSRINCISGVIDGTGSLFTFSYKPPEAFANDFYAICRNINDSYAEICYKSFNWMLLHSIEDRSIESLQKHAMQLSHGLYPYSALQNLAALKSSRYPEGNLEYMKECLVLSEDWQSFCIDGLLEGAYGYIQTSPHEADEKLFEICDSLGEHHFDYCKQQATRYISENSTNEKEYHEANH